MSSSREGLLIICTVPPFSSPSSFLSRCMNRFILNFWTAISSPLHFPGLMANDRKYYIGAFLFPRRLGLRLAFGFLAVICQSFQVRRSRPRQSCFDHNHDMTGRKSRSIPNQCTARSDLSTWMRSAAGSCNPGDLDAHSSWKIPYAHFWTLKARASHSL